VFVIRTRRGFLPSGGGSGLQTGDEIEATVEVNENGELDEDEVEERDHVDKIELEGTVVSYTAPSSGNAGALVVRVGGLQFTVVVAAGTDVGALKAGDRVEVKAIVNGTTLTLVKAESEDENDDGDDGDDGDDDGGGGDD
jgi:hypothetical protein